MGHHLSHDGDGTLSRDVFAEPDGTVSSRLRQVDRDRIMETTQQRRGSARKLDWGRLVLTIPVVDLARIKDRYPELRAPDAETRNRAWQRFIASSESAPYRT